MYVELLVGNESGTKVYQPVVQEGIEWSTERKNTPGKLVFKVLYDNILDFSEGSPVRMKVDGDNVFFGFVFKQQRTKDKTFKEMTGTDELQRVLDSIAFAKNKGFKVELNFVATKQNVKEIEIIYDYVHRMKLVGLKVLTINDFGGRVSVDDVETELNELIESMRKKIMQKPVFMCIIIKGFI